MIATPRHVIRRVTLAIGALALASALATPAFAAGEYDGRWIGKAESPRCALRAKIYIMVKGDRLTGDWRVSGTGGRGNGSYRFQGRVDQSDGDVRAQAGGAYEIRVQGDLSEGGGRWQSNYRNCKGRWTVRRLDDPASEPVVAAVEPPPPEPAPDAAASGSSASGNGTTAPTVRAPRDTIPPALALPGQLTTDGPTVELIGAVSDASRIVEVHVDGRPVAVASDGTFRIHRGVPVGESELTVTALDEWGNQALRRVRVSRKDAPAETAVANVDTDGAPPAAPSTGDDSRPPRIQLPAEIETDEAVITLEGRIVDESTVVELRINDRIVPLGAGGTFRVQRGVPEGTSDFEVVALDEWGNRGAAIVTVKRVSLALEFGRYHALVIGNNAYSGMPALRTAVADAEAIAETLSTRYGFTVDLLENATRYDIISAMSNLRATLTYEDNLLIYYAGHGVIDPVTERGYWLPIDADPDNPANWVANDDITNMLKAFPARHVLVVADSCYSGTLTRQAPARLETWEERHAWLERLIGKRSRTVFASGSLEPVADGGAGGHSVFAAALLDVLRENTEVIEAQGLFEPVRQRVVLNANQTPQYSDVRLAGHEGGDFVFVPQ